MHRCWPVALVLAAAACGPPQPATAPAATAPSTPGSTAGPATGPAPGSDGGTVTGVVAETMNSGGYTYARLTANGTDTWIAGDEFPIKVGDRMTAAVDLPMQNFRSRTLNRDFPVIYFVRQVAANGEALSSSPAAPGVPAMAGSHGDGNPAPAAPELIAPVAPEPGGVKVADVWARRAALSGKMIVVRGQLVKANYEIMGTNWYHLQDGSGVVAEGTHDLTITSSERASVGDVVTVTGALSTGKDFGAGYAYEAILENGTIRK